MGAARQWSGTSEASSQGFPRSSLSRRDMARHGDSTTEFVRLHSCCVETGDDFAARHASHFFLANIGRLVKFILVGSGSSVTSFKQDI